MSKSDNKKKLNRLLKKLEKANIPLESVTSKPLEKLLNTNALKNFEKIVKRVIERPKIIKESKEIDERRKKRLREQNELKKIKQDAKNEKFLSEHDEFRQVFKFDTLFNKSGDAEITARNYMKYHKQRLLNTINEQFPNTSSHYSDLVTELIMRNELDLQLLLDMEYVSQNLINKKDSDMADISGPAMEIELEVLEDSDDIFLFRLTERFKKLIKKG